MGVFRTIIEPVILQRKGKPFILLGCFHYTTVSILDHAKNIYSIQHGKGVGVHLLWTHRGQS